MAEIKRHWLDGKAIHALAASCVLLCVAAAGFLLFENISYFSACDFGPLFGTASSVILVGMFGLYRYAYKFYKDSFYHLLSIGWLLNGIYIFFETFFKSAENNLSYHLKVVVIGILTTLPFYLASFIEPEGNIDFKELALFTSLWMAGITVALFLTYWLVVVQYPALSDEIKFSIMTLGGVIFSAWALIRSGRQQKKRLIRDTHKEWAAVFPLTFYIYAGFQPFYLLKLIPGMSGFHKSILFAALANKVLNSIAALSIIRLDTGEVQKRLEQRSVLEDLGALTASIEHDIKNPLEVIDIELTSMRRKFQANEEILTFIKRLEEQKLRIYATTQIIPVLTGKREYYERFMEKTNVNDLINGSIKAVKKEMNTHNISFKAEPGRFYVKAYRPMLEQAIVNILRNAIEAIHETRRTNGLVDIKFKLERKPEDANEIRIGFEDNGCGIPDENLHQITKLFMTTRSKDKPNSGIGLFITKRILRVHNGRLEIKNNKNDGATVSMVLPQWIDSK